MHLFCIGRLFVAALSTHIFGPQNSICVFVFGYIRGQSNKFYWFTSKARAALKQKSIHMHIWNDERPLIFAAHQEYYNAKEIVPLFFCSLFILLVLVNTIILNDDDDHFCN